MIRAVLIAFVLSVSGLAEAQLPSSLPEAAANVANVNRHSEAVDGQSLTFDLYLPQSSVTGSPDGKHGGGSRSNDYTISALKEKGVIFNNINQNSGTKHDALVINGSQMTADELVNNDIVKSYLQKNKGVLVLNATGEHKKALAKYVGLAYGTHDSDGYFVVCNPGSKGREFPIYENPRMLEIKAEDFQDSIYDNIDSAALEAAQEDFRKEVKTKLGPNQLAENIIGQLIENNSVAAGIVTQDTVPDGLKYRQWRLPNDTQYWQLNTAWLSGYPSPTWQYPAPKPASGYQKGSFGHNTFVSVYLDNRPSNGGKNYQWFSVDFQGWLEAQKPGPNSTSVSGSTFKMPMNGDSHDVLNSKNFKYDGFGWAQMVYLMSFIPATGATTGIKNYQALPQTDNSSTEYHSGSSFDVGFSKEGLDASYSVDNSVVTEQPDWEVSVETDLSKPSYGWAWNSNNPGYESGKIENLNQINLNSFQPNSSGVMITDSVISDVRTFNFSYGVNMLTTAGYYHSGGAKDHKRKDVTLSPVNLQIDVDFGAVLYPLPNQLSISPSSVVGGDNTTGTITIDQNAPAGGITVSLSSSNSDWATVPATITIPEGKASTTFTIATKPVAGNSVATITANLNQIDVQANVTVQAS